MIIVHGNSINVLVVVLKSFSLVEGPGQSRLYTPTTTTTTTTTNYNNDNTNSNDSNNNNDTSNTI